MLTFREYMEGSQTNQLYQNLIAKMNAAWGGEAPPGTYTSTYFTKLGFDVPTLIQNGVIQNAQGGNFELNPQLYGRRSTVPLPPPPPPRIPKTGVGTPPPPPLPNR